MIESCSKYSTLVQACVAAGAGGLVPIRGKQLPPGKLPGHSCGMHIAVVTVRWLLCKRAASMGGGLHVLRLHNLVSDSITTSALAVGMCLMQKG